MNCNRIPLASIEQATVRPDSALRKPRLTYSSVIHSMVAQLTQRSPYLMDDEKDESDSDIALLYRDEVKTGELLGNGNFSNVFAVSELRLRPTASNLSKKDQVRAPGLDKDSEDSPENLKPRSDHHTKDEKVPPQAEMNDPSTSAKQSHSSPEQRRCQLRANLKREDGSCSYAVKCLKPELLEDPSPKVFLEAATDLVIEAKYLSKFNHENILKLRGLAEGWEAAYANGEYDSFFILVDRLEETLNKRIKRWRHGEFPEENTIATKLPLARQLASALSYLADRQLLFRDCKPQNIGLHRNADDTLSVKLFDFGFCRQLPVIEQARDDVEDTVAAPRITSLPSGETVFMMSGKGTRRYMAPEVLLHNRYNLKADVYSWSMVCWELLTLRKPFFKYTKDQHAHLVCEAGDRPPLESSVSPLWPSTSFHSLSVSLSSMPSSNHSIDEDSIDFSQVMTDPIRDLLTRAWHHDVSQRITMKQVLQNLDDILEILDEASPPHKSSSDLSNTRSTRGYSCLSAEYDDVRDLVAGFASDLPFPFLACFGLDNDRQKGPKENVDPSQTTTGLPESSEVSISKPKQSAVSPSQVEPEHVPRMGGSEQDNNAEPFRFEFPIPQLQTLIVQ